MIRVCNDEKIRTVRTDIGALAQVLQYALKYPAEQDCMLHVAAALSFIDGEPENEIQQMFIQKKIALAKSNPDAHAFFLTWGAMNIPEYNKDLNTSTSLDYLTKRTEQMTMILPDSLKHLTS
jgi:hypothetical protein